MSSPPPAPAREATRLSELTPRQWKSGIAAWLGWFFDGLELHLYTLVAIPLVMQLLHTTDRANPEINEKTTGPEIWNDTDGSIDVLVAGVGTGGTITGISRFIKNIVPIENRQSKKNLFFF